MTNIERKNIVENTISQINDKVDRIIDENNLIKLVRDENDPRRSLFDSDDLREFRGLLNFEEAISPVGGEDYFVLREKIRSFDREYEYWKNKSDLETAEPQKSIYKGFSEIAKLYSDKTRIKNNEKPISEEGIQILNENAEESDLGRLERLKKWAKENLLGLSAVSIAAASIITAIVMGARNALKQGANAVGKLGKAIANIGKNFGAVISAVLNLISQILSWGAKGIAFLAKNLWILAIAITYFLYNEYKEYRKSNKD